MKLHRGVKTTVYNTTCGRGSRRSNLLFLKTTFLKKRDELKYQSDYMIPFQHSEVEACVLI